MLGFGPLPRSGGQRAMRTLCLLAGALLLVLACALLLLRTETGLQLVARQVAASTGMQLDGVSGSLFGPLHIKQLRLKNREMALQVQDLEFDYVPSQLLKGHLQILRLQATQVNYETLAASTTPLTLPTSLELPINVLLPALRVQKILLKDGKNTLELQELNLPLRITAQHYQIQAAQVVSQWGALKLEAKLASQAPFALQGKLDFVSAQHGQLALQVGGNLQALQLNAQGKASQAQFDLRSTVHPFSSTPLTALLLRGEGINPAAFNPAWPQAAIQIDSNLTLASEGKRAISGKLALRNLAPGALDQQKLPFAQLTSDIKGDWPQASKQDPAPWPQLAFKQVLLDLAQAGQFTGEAGLQNKLLQLQLSTTALNLQGVQSKLKATNISGQIALQQEVHGQSLRAKLAQAEMVLHLDAKILPEAIVVQQASLEAKNSKISLQGKLALTQPRNFSAKGDITHFNPANWGKFASADINLGLALEGILAEDALNSALKLDAHMLPSRLWGQDLRGNVSAQAEQAHVQQAQLALSLGQNNLSAKGTLGRIGDKLQWQVNAPQLAALQAGLGRQLSGKIHANGVAQGDLKTLSTSVNLVATDLLLTNAKIAAGSSISAQGEVQLHAPWAIKLAASSRQFNPAAVLTMPDAKLNADLSLQGQIGLDWQQGPWQVKFEAKDSTWQDAPLSASLAGSWQQARFSQLTGKLHIGDNLATWQGSFGLPSDVLSANIKAAQLQQLNPNLGGQMTAQLEASADVRAVLAGKWDSLALKVEGQATALSLPNGEHLKQVSTKLSLPAGQSSTLSWVASLDDLQAGTFKLNKASLQLSGSRNAHELTLRATQEKFNLQLGLQGGLRQTETELAWQGQITQFVNQGAYPLQLSRNGALFISHQALSKMNNLRLENLAVQVGGGQLTIDSLAKNGASWQTRGQLQHLPLKFLLPQAEDLHSDMLLAGSWEVSYLDSLTGRLQIQRESGDLRTSTSAASSLQTKQLQALLTAKQNALNLAIDFDSPVVGFAHLQANSKLSVQDGQLGLAGSAPLHLQAEANLRSLSFLAPLSGVPDVEFGGQLVLQAQADGSISAPQLRGQISAQQLSTRWPSLGLKLKNGSLQAKLQDDQLQLQQFSIEGQQGSATASGWLKFAQQKMQMQIDAQLKQLQVLGRPDRQLVVSGTTHLQLDKKVLSIKGDLLADSADIELTIENGPTYSDDVVIVGAPPVKNTSQALTLDLGIDLGENFRLRGNGLRAELDGALRLQALDKRGPRASGSIGIKSGSYRAYGQNLTVTYGKLNFSGALDNPGLNLLAVRKVQNPESEVEAGIELRGTLQAPQARLVSTPSVPDSEKLMWLVLGHGTEGGADKDNPLLGLAMGALFGGAQSDQFASKLAIDEINLTQAQGLESTVVSVGKRLSSKAFLTLEQGASSATSLLKLRYTFNPRLSVQVQTGTNNAVDVFYTWRFD